MTANRRVFLGGMTLFGLLAFGLQATAAPTTITFLSRSTSEPYKQLIKQFEAENPGIKVEMTMSTAPTWGADAEQIIARQVAGDPYDVIYIATEGSRALSSAGVLLPLNTWMNSDAYLQAYKKDVPPALFKMFEYKGQQYQFPFEWNNMVVYYNTELFSKAGIPQPETNWTWHDYVSIAKKLTIRNGDGKATQYGTAPYGGWYFGDMPWIFTAGGTLLNQDWTKAASDTAPLVEALQQFQDMTWRDQVAPPPGVGGFYDQANNLGMWGAGRWPVQSYMSNKFTNFDIQVWPQRVERGSVLGGGGWGIDAATKHLAAAKKLVKFLLSTQAFNLITEAGDSMPSRLTVAFSGAVSEQTPKHYKVYVDALKYARTVPAPPAYPKLETIYQKYAALVEQNKMTAQDGAEHIVTEINAALGAK